MVSVCDLNISHGPVFDLTFDNFFAFSKINHPKVLETPTSNKLECISGRLHLVLVKLKLILIRNMSVSFSAIQTAMAK